MKSSFSVFSLKIKHFYVLFSSFFWFDRVKPVLSCQLIQQFVSCLWIYFYKLSLCKFTCTYVIARDRELDDNWTSQSNKNQQNDQ